MINELAFRINNDRNAYFGLKLVNLVFDCIRGNPPPVMLQAPYNPPPIIHQQDYENCCICRTPLWDGVNDNLKVVVICNNRHAFHEDYIQRWFNRPNIPRTCIVCQREILIPFSQLDRNAIYRLDMRNRDRRLNLERSGRE
ncbi:30537_t:CDS:2, partial [Gigaspora margarita]